MRHCLMFSLLIVASIAPGCQSGPPADSDAAPPGGAQRDKPTDSRPVAYIDGVAVTRDGLHHLLIEAQGGQVLSEILLDRAITRRLSEQGLTLTDNDLQAERDQLLAGLSDDADQATRLLKMMRDQRGLGEKRFAMLLRRNAGLRILVKDGVGVSDASIRQAYAVRYGKRYRVRLITADTIDALTNARRRVLAGESFTDLAIAVSTDASVSQGGLLSPISPADAAYPKAIRDAMPKLSLADRASRLSPVIALPEGFALLWLEEVIEREAPPIDAVRDELARVVRLELERVRMRQLARVLIDQANVVVLDPALDQSWQNQRGAIVQP